MIERTLLRDNKYKKSINDILNGFVTTGAFYFSNLNNTMYVDKKYYEKKYPVN